MDLFQMMRAPAYHRWLGIVLVSAAGGEVEVRLPYREEFLGDDADVSFSRAPRYADAQLRIDWIPSYRHQLSLTSLWSSDQLEFDVDVENAIDPMYTGNFTATDRFWRTIASWRYERGRFEHRAALAFGGGFREQHINDTHFYELRPYELAATESSRTASSCRRFTSPQIHRAPEPRSPGRRSSVP